MNTNSGQGKRFESLAELNAADRFTVIHDELRRRICLLIYPPDSRLNESGLAAEFGVSRTPIRRVLAQLEAEGLVESHQGSPTKVTRIELAALQDEYELRMKLAELVGEMGVVPAGEDDLVHLQELCVRLNAMIERPTSLEYAEINLEFHQNFLRRIRNTLLQLTTDQLYYRTARMWLSNLPKIDWQSEILQFRRQVEMMIDVYRINDDRGIGLLQRHIIYSSLVRLKEYTRKTKST